MRAVAKYRIRKLVNGEFRVDEKMHHVFKIPLTEWSCLLPFWYWYEKNSSFKTMEEAKSFLATVVKNAAAKETLHNETRHYSAKGERVMDSWL